MWRGESNGQARSCWDILMCPVLSGDARQRNATFSRLETCELGNIFSSWSDTMSTNWSLSNLNKLIHTDTDKSWCLFRRWLSSMISVPGIVITRSVRGRLSGLRWPDPRWSRRLVSLLTPELGRIPSSYDTTRPGSRAAPVRQTLGFLSSFIILLLSMLGDLQINLGPNQVERRRGRTEDNNTCCYSCFILCYYVSLCLTEMMNYFHYQWLQTTTSQKNHGVLKSDHLESRSIFLIVRLFWRCGQPQEIIIYPKMINNASSSVTTGS